MARILIGLKIRDRRKALGITQARLSENLGISASYLNLIESNKRNIGGGLLKRIATALDMTIDRFDGAIERRLVSDVHELTADPLLAALQLDPSSSADFVGHYPLWAQALVTLQRAYLDSSETVTALSDRLNQDPFLGDAVHSMLGNVAAIRSAAEILEHAEELDPTQEKRFRAIITAESDRLSTVAQALAAFFDKAHTSTRSITPIEEVDDFLFERGNYFPALEQAASDLRAHTEIEEGRIESALIDYLERIHRVAVMTRSQLPSHGPEDRHRPFLFDQINRTLTILDTATRQTRVFQLARITAELSCAGAIDLELRDAPQLATLAAQRRARHALSSYLASATLLPYDAFRSAAVEARYDIEYLCQKFDASYEQICHRLMTLRKPGAEGIRFGFMRADPAGYVTKRFPLPHLPLPRYGNACPLWAIYKAFQTPGAIVRQLAEFPTGERYLFLAHTVEKQPAVFSAPRHLMSIMLVCDVIHADQTVYGGGIDLSPNTPATLVGQTCRLCVRRSCAYREEDPIINA